MKEADIDALIPAGKRGEFARLFLREYLKDGFAASTARSTEILVFHLLEKLGSLADKDNLSASHLLQITETKLKGLRYESKLRYAPEEEKYVERRILYALAKSEFDADGKRIKFIMEDTYVRKALAGESKRLGGVPDTSFNTEIVVLRPEQLTALLDRLFGKDVAKLTAEEIAKVMKKDGQLTFAELRNKFLIGVTGAAGGGLVAAIRVALTGGAAA